MSSSRLERVRAVTDPNHHTTSNWYASAGRLITVTDPRNEVTSYGYDPGNRRVTITDPLNHTTTTAFAGCYGHAVRELVAKDPVLGLEVLDHPGEFALGGGGEEQPEGLKKAGHGRAIVSKKVYPTARESGCGDS
jgi:YD repeat-containing protein